MICLRVTSFRSRAGATTNEDWLFCGDAILVLGYLAVVLRLNDGGGEKGAAVGIEKECCRCCGCQEEGGCIDNSFRQKKSNWSNKGVSCLKSMANEDLKGSELFGIPSQKMKGMSMFEDLL